MGSTHKQNKYLTQNKLLHKYTPNNVPGVACLVDVFGELSVDFGLARADVILTAVEHALQLHRDVVCVREE